MAILFEVTSSKPGNVNLTTGFAGTRIEHFLASAVAAITSFRKAAKNGIAILNGKMETKDAAVGWLMKECVSDISSWQKGGNTLLGTVMLFMPLAIASGMTPTDKKHNFDINMIRKNLRLIVEATTAQDAVSAYEAIAIANPSGLNQAPDLDVKAEESKERLTRENISLFKVFQIAAKYDDICYEWVNNFPITFDMAYPLLGSHLKTKNLNTAIVNSFLKVLSERPDTFISRKAGKEKALEISREAKEVLIRGGIETTDGHERLISFDEKLRRSGNNCNPGTTADIIAAALALCTLSGYRP